ncbi:MAG TPA: LarC family nickel insertion protein, partial [Bacteroidota bacterium]
HFGEAPSMTVEQIGYGAGEKEFPDRPNVFRLVLGQDSTGWEQDEMVVIETNIDDMNPEFFDYVLDRLFAAGARDVFLSPIQMKKNRPGTLLRIIAEPALREKLGEIVFRETTTIGLRYYPVKRMILKRAASRVKTKFGAVKVKIIEEPDGTKRATPEYEDLRRIAAAKKIPLKVLYDEVVRSFKR